MDIKTYFLYYRAETTDSPSRRFRDLRRSEIKERLSRLNEKLSSPTERVPLTSDFKHGEDPANKFKPRAFRSFKEYQLQFFCMIVDGWLANRLKKYLVLLKMIFQE